MEVPSTSPNPEPKVKVEEPTKENKSIVIPPEKDNQEYLANVIINIKNKLLSFYVDAINLIQKSEEKNVAKVKEILKDQHQQFIEACLKKLGLSKEQYGMLLDKYRGCADIKDSEEQIHKLWAEVEAGKVPSIFKMHFDITEFNKIYQTYIYANWCAYRVALENATKDKKDEKEKIKLNLLTEEEKQAFLQSIEDQDIPSKVCKYFKVINKEEKLINSQTLIYATAFYILHWDPINKSNMLFLSEINQTMYMLIQMNCQLDELAKDPLTLTEAEIDAGFKSLVLKAQAFAVKLNERIDELNANAKQPEQTKVTKEMAEKGAIFTYKIVMHLKEALYETCYNYIKNIKNPQAKSFNLDEEFNSQSNIIFAMYGISIEDFQMMCATNSKDEQVYSVLQEISQCKSEIKAKLYPTILKKYIDLDLFRKLYPMFLYTQWHYQYKLMQEVMQTSSPDSIQANLMLALLKVCEMHIASKTCTKYKLEFPNKRPEEIDCYVYSTLYYALVNEPKYAAQLHFLSELDAQISASLLSGNKCPELDEDIEKLTDEQKMANLKSLIGKHDTYLTCCQRFQNPSLKPIKAIPEVNFPEEKLSEDIEKKDVKFIVDVLLVIKFHFIDLYYELMKYYSYYQGELFNEFMQNVEKEYDSLISVVVRKLHLSTLDYKFLLNKYEQNPDVVSLLEEFKLYKNELKAKKPISIFKKYLDLNQLTKVFPQYMFAKWHIYYREFNKILKDKTPVDGKINVTKEEIIELSAKINKEKVSQKVFEKLNIPIKETAYANYDFMMQSTYYYALLNDPMVANQLQFFSQVNRMIHALIEKGHQLNDLEVDPLTLPLEENETKLNALITLASKCLAMIQNMVAERQNPTEATAPPTEESKN